MRAAIHRADGMAGGRTAMRSPVPQRPGHGKTGGTYYEDQGGCTYADFRKAGLNTALRSAAVGFMIVSRSSGRTAPLPSASRPAAGARCAGDPEPPAGQSGDRLRASRGGRIDGVTAATAPRPAGGDCPSIRREGRMPSLWIYARMTAISRPNCRSGWWRDFGWAAATPTFICCRGRQRRATT